MFGPSRVGGATAGGLAVRSSLDCDLNASILNPNRIFSATDSQETEITNKLVLVFNKFARTMASMGRSPHECDGAKRNRQRHQSSGGGHGKVSSQGVGLVGRSRRLVRSTGRSLFDPYRPEQHYMRGPGPKWHAKHDRAPLGYRAIPGSCSGAHQALILGPRGSHRSKRRRRTPAAGDVAQPLVPPRARPSALT